MIMRNTMLFALGMVAAPAMAGPTATVTAIDGTMGTFFDNGQIHGHSYNFAPGGGASSGPPRNLYDNIPTFLGGTADAGNFGPFGIYGTFLFADWTTPSAQWGDDLHQISAGGGGPAVITSLWYGYSNSATATNTHVIKIYDVVSPSATHGTATTTFTGFSKGAVLTAVTLTALPSGQNFVTVGINSVQAGGYHVPGPAAISLLGLGGLLVLRRRRVGRV